MFTLRLKYLFNLIDQNNHNSNRAKIRIVTKLEVNENTFKRFDTLLIDLMEKRKKNMDYDDLLNELIDNYQQNNWDQFMVAGG
jgi:hypothetical protein